MTGRVAEESVSEQATGRALIIREEERGEVLHEGVGILKTSLVSASPQDGRKLCFAGVVDRCYSVNPLHHTCIKPVPAGQNDLSFPRTPHSLLDSAPDLLGRFDQIFYRRGPLFLCLRRIFRQFRLCLQVFDGQAQWTFWGEKRGCTIDQFTGFVHKIEHFLSRSPREFALQQLQHPSERQLRLRHLRE